ncbi:Oligopeptide transporter OPT superfamily [Penicillium roqueforti FM164]|uniref:Oligopeptide transporter OPT superfamily n=1 Tax=Penicillium roqueforti (strain FM164) TaxID=1365484 RepID=W6QLZ4_PENRF|nr:Oligopeptide transporter OPT superfamily [Penicillium roqueforti FM164]
MFLPVATTTFCFFFFWPSKVTYVLSTQNENLKIPFLPQYDPESESIYLLPRRPSSHGPLTPQSFTWRALLVGLLVGILISLCNTYYGLQTGAGAQLPTVSALLGYLAIGALAKFNFAPLSKTENVLIVSTATATGCMPATAGFTEVIPALEYILGPNEGGPFRLEYLQLITWSLGLSFFGR